MKGTAYPMKTEHKDTLVRNCYNFIEIQCTFRSRKCSEVVFRTGNG